MAIKTEEKQIGSSSFKINTLNNERRMEFTPRLIKLFGDSIPTLIVSLSGEVAASDVETLEAVKAQQEGLDLTPEQEVLLSKRSERSQEIFASGVTKASQMFIAGLGREDITGLAKDLYSKSQVQKDNKLVGFNDVEFDELVQILIWILVENFAPLFRVGGIVV